MLIHVELLSQREEGGILETWMNHKGVRKSIQLSFLLTIQAPCINILLEGMLNIIDVCPDFFSSKLL